MEKCIYIYERVINLSKEYRSMNLKKEKKSKASKTCSKTLPSPFDTRSTNNAFNVVGKYSLVGGEGRAADSPIKLAFRRFWSWFEKFGIVVSRDVGRGLNSRVSATHINRFARRTASKRWLTDGKEAGRREGSVERGYPCVKNSCRRCRKLSL